MLPKVPFTETQAFKNLKNQAARMKEIHMRSLFQGDSDRFKKFTICFQDILLDYSKNKIDVEVMAALTDLAKECKLDDAIQAMFSGKSINETEGRAVLHTALRTQSDEPIIVDGENIIPLIRSVQAQMEAFSAEIISGNWKYASGSAHATHFNVAYCNKTMQFTDFYSRISYDFTAN